jgi:hypothetical protein
MGDAKYPIADAIFSMSSTLARTQRPRLGGGMSMLVSINSAIRNFDARFQNIDLDGIQRIVDTLSDLNTRTAAKADPNAYMIKEMQKHNIPTPDGLHFHFRQGDTLVPPEGDDVDTTSPRLVLSGAPGKPFELEFLQMGGAAVTTGVLICRRCQVCIYVEEVM